jgi:hypothetical protein
MVKFKFRLSGTDKYFKIKNNENCVFSHIGGIAYISAGIGNTTEIVILPGFKPIDKNTYVDVIKEE